LLLACGLINFLPKEQIVDKMIKSTAYGEIGIDSEASPGNGEYYVKLYDGSYDVCGYDTEAEAWEDLIYLGNEIKIG
jgi:hypothetical protein